MARDFDVDLDELLDNSWELFNYLIDDSSKDLRNAAYYFVKEHGFDVNVLPLDLCSYVVNRIKEEDLEFELEYDDMNDLLG